MSSVSLVRRMIVLVLALGIPAGAVGLAIGWIRGAIALETAAAFLLLLAAVRSEAGILRAYRVLSETPVGLRRSLAQVTAGLGGEAPRVRVFNDPAPGALVVRALGSPGSILVSEGLLGLLTEEELRELLRICVARARARGSVFQSLCAWLAHLALALAPAAWVELLFGELRWHEQLSPFGALRFATAFSVGKFFVGLGSPDGETARALKANAPHTYRHLSRVTGEVSNPGSCILHLVDPWEARATVPLLRS